LDIEDKVFQLLLTMYKLVITKHCSFCLIKKLTFANISLGLKKKSCQGR